MEDVFHVKYRLPSRGRYELLNSTVEINCSGKYVARETQPMRASIKLDFCRIVHEAGDDAWQKIEDEFFPFHEDTNWGFEFG